MGVELLWNNHILGTGEKDEQGRTVGGVSDLLFLSRISWAALGVDDLEGAAILDDDVVHVHGPEVGEVLGEGDEVDGRPAVELEQVGVFVVPLPSQGQQLLLQRSVGGDHLVAGDVQKRLAADCAQLLVLYEPHHAVLEHPDSRHLSFSSSEEHRGSGLVRERPSGSGARKRCTGCALSGAASGTLYTGRRQLGDGSLCL